MCTPSHSPATLEEYVNIHIFNYAPYESYADTLHSIHVRRTAKEWSIKYELDLAILGDLNRTKAERDEILYNRLLYFWDWASLYAEHILGGPKYPKKPIGAIALLDIIEYVDINNLKHPRERTIQFVRDEYGVSIDPTQEERLMRMPLPDFTNEMAKAMVAHFVANCPPTEETKNKVAAAMARMAERLHREDQELEEYNVKLANATQYAAIKLECDAYKLDVADAESKYNALKNTFLLAVRRFVKESETYYRIVDAKYKVSL